MCLEVHLPSKFTTYIIKYQSFLNFVVTEVDDVTVAMEQTHWNHTNFTVAYDALDVALGK